MLLTLCVVRYVRGYCPHASCVKRIAVYHDCIASPEAAKHERLCVGLRKDLVSDLTD